MDDYYTKKYGGESVTNSDVLSLFKETPNTTTIGSLSNADHIPSNTFDSFILTQRLQLIYDVQSAISTIHRILKPGGAVLATIPGISHSDDKVWCNNWCWNFTSLSAKRRFEKDFPSSNAKVESHGNLLTAISSLHGLAVQDLSKEELDNHDPGYKVLIPVKSVK